MLNLEEICADLKPTVAIGAAAIPGAFTEQFIQLMGEFNEQPIIFALSNPTSKAECTAEQAYRLTQVCTTGIQQVYKLIQTYTIGVLYKLVQQAYKLTVVCTSLVKCVQLTRLQVKRHRRVLTPDVSKDYFRQGGYVIS